MNGRSAASVYPLDVDAVLKAAQAFLDKAAREHTYIDVNNADLRVTEIVECLSLTDQDEAPIIYLLWVSEASPSSRLRTELIAHLGTVDKFLTKDVGEVHAIFDVQTEW